MAAYTYMALVPMIQPPFMKLCTTKAQRKIKMKSLRQVSKGEKLFFCFSVTIVTILLCPDAAPLLGMLMFGNFLRECKVTERLVSCAQNELMNITTILLGVSVGLTMQGSRFLEWQTLKIIILGVVAFAVAHRFSDWQHINAETWRAMEELMKAGKIRAIGVSNFMPHHLDALLSTADVVPAVNQIEFHPGCKQPECVDYCRAHGILVEAWSPLGCGRVLGNEILGRVAARHHCSPAQLCLCWILQQGILPLPKSSTPQRMRDNLELPDVELTPEDMQELDALGSCGASGLHPDTIDF